MSSLEYGSMPTRRIFYLHATRIATYTSVDARRKAIASLADCIERATAQEVDEAAESFLASIVGTLGHPETDSISQSVLMQVIEKVGGPDQVVQRLLSNGIQGNKVWRLLHICGSVFDNFDNRMVQDFLRFHYCRP